jgi:hypothetical protein
MESGRRTAALVSSAVAFLAYLIALPPVPYWLDAPEFMAAGANLGLPHPPGHPSMLLLLKAFLLLPFGDMAFRANLFSATFAAVSAGLVSLLATDAASAVSVVAHHPHGRSRWPALGGLAAGIGFALSGSVVLQAMSVEVYTFSCALVLGALVIATRYPADARAGCLAAILLALGLANHHLLVLLAIPAVAMAWLRRDVRWSAVLAVAATGFVVTVACYLYLPVRGAAGAEPTWADTSSFEGTFWYASARIFAASLGGHAEAGSSMGENAIKGLGLLAGALSPLVLVASLAGVWLLVRSGAGRWALVLLLLVVGNLPSKVAMGILDPSNPDDHGYFLPAVAGLAILAAAAGAALPILAASLGATARRVASGLGVAVLATLALAPLAASGATMFQERADLREPSALARSVWESVPPRAVLLSSHYPVHFLLMYGQDIEGARPDVTLVQQTLYAKARGGRTYATRLGARDPDLGPFTRSFLWTGDLDWELLRALAARRPVWLMASDDLAAPLGDVRFDGWTFDVVPPGVGTPVPPLESAAHLADLRDAVWHWPTVDIETRRVLLRHLATAGTWLAGQGHRDAAIRLLDAALELNPRDALLRRMRLALGGA